MGKQMISTDGRIIKAIEIQVRFDGNEKGFKAAYDMGHELRRQFAYLRVVKTVDGLHSRDPRQIKLAYYLESTKLPLRSWERVVGAWFEGKQIIKIKYQP